MTKYMCVAAVALVSTSLAALGCSSEADPEPSGAGAPGVGGASAGTGGTNANPAPGGAPAGGAPVGGASVGGASGGSAGAAPTGDVAQGESLYSGQCIVCHGPGAVGGLGPNITGSTTAGIGSWTEAQFTRSVKEAVDENGQKLCSSMLPFSGLSDAQVKNLYAYLRSLKDDTVNAGTQCP